MTNRDDTTAKVRVGEGPPISPMRARVGGVLAEPSPTLTKTGVRISAPRRPTHPTEPADHCRPCRSERLAETEST